MPSVDIPSAPEPYTLDIQQGTAIDQKMIDRLQAGMTRNQVSLILGTPLLADVMHADRWDYVYYTRKKGQVGEWRRFTCYFKEDRLVSITGDVTLAPNPAKEGVSPAPTGSGSNGIPTLPSSGLPSPLPNQDGPGAKPVSPLRP
jgi:outer membrane protein assembly factor BamE (lipoprotein component of BamABCDE complex)